MNWCPCYSPEKLKNLIGDYKEVDLNYIKNCGISDPDFLYIALREHFFKPEILIDTARVFAWNARVIGNESALEAYENATKAAFHVPVEMPDDEDTKTWLKNSTKAEIAAGLAAMWAAIAKGRLSENEVERKRLWNNERRWQADYVLDLAKRS